MITSSSSTLLRTEDFVRYEFKFPLDLRKREEVESEVAKFMSFDGHVHSELSNAYYVRSLYYDNDVATNYYEKIDGVKMRRKFRLRTYGKLIESSLPIYLEVPPIWVRCRESALKYAWAGSLARSSSGISWST